MKKNFPKRDRSLPGAERIEPETAQRKTLSRAGSSSGNATAVHIADSSPARDSISKPAHELTEPNYEVTAGYRQEKIVRTAASALARSFLKPKRRYQE